MSQESPSKRMRLRSDDRSDDRDGDSSDSSLPPVDGEPESDDDDEHDGFIDVYNTSVSRGITLREFCDLCKRPPSTKRNVTAPVVTAKALLVQEYKCYAYQTEGDLDYPQPLSPLDVRDSKKDGITLRLRFATPSESSEIKFKDASLVIEDQNDNDWGWLEMMLGGEPKLTITGHEEVPSEVTSGSKRKKRGKEEPNIKLQIEKSTCCCSAGETLGIRTCSTRKEQGGVVVKEGDLLVTATVEGERRHASVHLFFDRSS